MADSDDIVFEGRRYPGDVTPLEEHLYDFPIGGNRVVDLTWKGHLKIAHDAGVESMTTEIIDSGVTERGVRFAAAKVTVVLDGREFSAVQAADETTNQVRDPEYVYAVAESRALKRAVKKALNIYPLEEGTDPDKARMEEALDASESREEPPGDIESYPSEWDDEDEDAEVDLGGSDGEGW